MGLSSSKSRTSTNENTTTNQTTSGTQTPIAPDYLTQAAQDYVGRIGDFGQMDPNSFVAGSSPLQQMAWDNVGALSGWQGQAQTAAQMAQQAGSTGANYAGRTAPAGTGGGMQAPRGTQGGSAFTYGAPQLGNAALVSGQGYSAPQLGGAQGYAAARIGQPIGATAANATGVNASDRMGAYQNPFQQQVIDTTLAGLDQSGQQQQARLAAAGARNGAFGGSRFGIAEGQLGADLALGRGQMEAGLRSQGFNTAAALGGQDAAMANQLAQFNAANQTGVSQFNADAANRAAMAQAGLDTDASRYGAEMGNQFGLAQAGFNQNAGQFNAGLNMQGQLANQGAQNQFGLAQAGLAADAGQFNAAANNQMSQFNAGQGDAAQQRALQAAALLQSGAGQYAGDTRADLGTMAALGEQQRGVEQQQAMAPLAQLQAMGQLSGMTPYDILVGRQVNGTQTGTGTATGTSTTTQSPSLFNQMLAGGQFAASLFSDRVLKRDIERAGTMPSGLGLYRYRYNWDEPDRPLRMGVMADEVEDLAPEALGPVINGFRTVDYQKLGLAHLVEA